jgi:hypothetical protein
MTSTVEKQDVWMAHLDNAPGALGRLLTPLVDAGANLEFLFARPNDPGKAVAFLAPLKGAQQIKAAKALGLIKLTRILSLRIQGPNRRGIGAKLTQALGDAGINLQGFSAMGLGNSGLFYVALNKADVTRALKTIKALR